MDAIPEGTIAGAPDLGVVRSADFSGFYERELADQVRRATLLIGDHDAARDLVHDAFVEVYRRWHRLREPGPYLHTAVLNRCRDHGRRAQRWSRPRPVPPTGDQPSTDDQPSTGDQPTTDDGLWDALQQLPFNHRAVLVLRFHHQLTNDEIATTLGCAVGSVGPWMQRGLARLRKDLS